MPLKTARARSAKPAARRKPAAKKKLKIEFTPEEVAHLEKEAAQQTRSEQTWQAMTSASPSREEDHWSGVEEHLLAKSSQDDDGRRWKYFGK